MKKGLLTTAMVGAAATAMFTSCTVLSGSSTSYKNKNTDSSCAGTFKAFNGKIKEDVKFGGTNSFNLTFESECKKGTIKAVLIDKNSDETIYDFESGGSTVFEPSSKGKYKIVITLDHAKNGEYTFKWDD